MRIAAEPIGFTKTDMKYGKCNHTKIFDNMDVFDAFARDWQDTILEKPPASETMLIPREEIEPLVEDLEAQANNPMVALYVKAYKNYPDMVCIARSISGAFIVREFE